MTPPEEIDCVELKRTIQAQIAADLVPVTWPERLDRIRAAAASGRLQEKWRTVGELRARERR
ncbi:MAG: hypothetical protein ACR2HN_13030 [Tepidiformaceae bacterium]